MRTSAQIFLLAALLLSCAAHQKSWKELDTESRMLIQQGRYSEAAKVTDEAVKVAEKQFGPNHPAVVKSLNNLGAVYTAQGKYAEAEPLCKRALEIGEKTLGPNHPQVAKSLRILGAIYRIQGKYAEAEPLLKFEAIYRNRGENPWP
jgi:tetratricopeptide (TPR) repeat protein